MAAVAIHGKTYPIVLPKLRDPRLHLSAVVRRVRNDNSRTVREVQVGSSYLSSEDPRVHFGLGSDTSARELTVRFPDGTIRRIQHPSVDRMLTVTQ